MGERSELHKVLVFLLFFLCYHFTLVLVGRHLISTSSLPCLPYLSALHIQNALSCTRAATAHYLLASRKSYPHSRPAPYVQLTFLHGAVVSLVCAPLVGCFNSAEQRIACTFTRG